MLPRCFPYSAIGKIDRLQEQPFLLVNMGAITLTICARFAIFTTSAWRKNELKNMPMARRLRSCKSLRGSSRARDTRRSTRRRRCRSGARWAGRTAPPDQPRGHLDAVIDVPATAPRKRSRSFSLIADVGVERDVVDLRRAACSSTVRFHADPVGARAEVAGAAGDQLDRAVHRAHRLGRFQRELGVLLGVLVAELPGTVDLIAQTPDTSRYRAPRGRSCAAGRPSRCGAPRWCTPPSRARRRLVPSPALMQMYGSTPMPFGSIAGIRRCRSGWSRCRPRRSPGRTGR